MNPKTFVFIGRSGCGKGTQAKLLGDYLKEKTPEVPVFYMETGHVFRDFISRDSYSSNLAKEINEKGGLQPEFLAIWAWSHILVENLRGDEHLIIDGTPRKAREAAVLDSAFKFYKREKPFVIYINVSKDWSRERLLSRKRLDDTKADIEKRLEWFESEVMPAIDYFRGNEEYSFVDILGEQPIEAIHKELVAKIFE